MNNKTVLLIIALFLITLQPSFAAFPVKHNPVSAVNAHKAAGLQTGKHKSPAISRFAANVVSAVNACNMLLHPEKPRTNANGTASLVFGILGLVTIPIGIIFSIPAIILGSIGMKQDEDCARAGHILGIVGTILSGVIGLIILLAIYAG